jgi:hypothetical protein
VAAGGGSRFTIQLTAKNARYRIFHFFFEWPVGTDEPGIRHQNKCKADQK